MLLLFALSFWLAVCLGWENRSLRAEVRKWRRGYNREFAFSCTVQKLFTELLTKYQAVKGKQ